MKFSSDILGKMYQASVDLHTRPIGSLVHAGGIEIHKDSKADGVGAQTDQLFQLTGAVRLMAVETFVEKLTDNTTFSNVKFDLWDGGASDDITAAVDLSAATNLIDTGSIIWKNNTSGNALATVRANNCTVGDPALAEIYSPCILTQKGDGSATFVRLCFTGDGATDIDLHIHAIWEPLSDAGWLKAV